MLVMQLPDGTKCEYRLRSVDRSLRLLGACASYDLVTMVRDSGWIIHEVKSDIARKRLRRAFGPTASRSTFVTANPLEAAM
jgi:hypothetical protein